MEGNFEGILNLIHVVTDFFGVAFELKFRSDSYSREIGEY